MAVVREEPAVGIALGGGVVRGFAHLGVLQVLEEAGIPIRYVSGASVGALMGYSYAAGMRPAHILEMAQTAGWLRFVRPAFPRQGLLSFKRLYAWMIEVMGDLHFCDLARPFAVMTTDIEQGVPYAICTGPVAPAVLASCSVPGFFEPVHLHGRILVDGGISNNVPAKPLRALGADYVIGVDVFRHAYHRPWGPLSAGMAAVEIMVRQSGSGIQAADCVISPELEKATYLRFSRRAQLVQLGREAAEACLPQILADLKALQTKTIPHATRTTPHTA